MIQDQVMCLPSGHRPNASYVINSLVEKQSWSSITWADVGDMPESKKKRDGYATNFR